MSSPTIKEAWDVYTDGFSSPQKFLDWSFLFLISASLGRRVWTSGDEHPCFSNMYPILVGRPGIGKDLPIKTVSNLLKHWKMGDNKDLMGTKLSEHKTAVEAMIETDTEKTQKEEYQGKVETQETIRPLIFPVAPDATTYEALIQAVCESHRRVQFPKYSDKLQKMILGTYGHCSITFALPELASLFKRRAEDTITYLLGTYDCPEDYEYRTKHNGRDRVRRACVNLLGGIQPDIIQEIFSDKVISAGMSSRMFFIFASKSRKYVARIPSLTPEQIVAKELILNHIKKLSVLYGRLEASPETWDFFDKWWINYQENPCDRANKASTLESYYARKNIHVLKVATAKHFSESVEMMLPQETIKWAIDFTAEEEKTMHFALDFGADNPLFKVGKRIKQFLTTGEKSWIDLLLETEGVATQSGLTETLNFLAETGQVRSITRIDTDTNKTTVYWSLA